MGTWNIRTMYETGKAITVAMEMKRYNIALLGLAETRWLKSGQVRLVTGEQILYSGHDKDGAAHTEGVGFMLSKKGTASTH